MGRVAVRADQPVVTGDEQVLHDHDVALDPARDGDDLVHPPSSVGIGGGVHDDVDTGRHGGQHEAGGDVLPGQQRQGAELDHSLAGAVRVHRGHAGHAGVERHQQIQTLLLSHLSDQDAARG